MHPIFTSWAINSFQCWRANTKRWWTRDNQNFHIDSMKHDFGLHHNKTQAFIFYFDFLSCNIWQSSLTDSAPLQDNVHAVFPMDNWSKLLLRVPQEPRWKEKHRALLHPNIYFEAIIKIIFTTWTLPLCLNNLDYPSINSKFPHSPRNYSYQKHFLDE